MGGVVTAVVAELLLADVVAGGTAGLALMGHRLVVGVDVGPRVMELEPGELDKTWTLYAGILECLLVLELISGSLEGVFDHFALHHHLAESVLFAEFWAAVLVAAAVPIEVQGVSVDVFKAEGVGVCLVLSHELVG
jgi:hypothetical protein